jgi:hypothetical protein
MLDRFRSDISLQVMGYFLMKLGAKMENNVKEIILRAIDEDEWSLESEERKSRMIAFRNRVVNYNQQGGTPEEMPQKGLFQILNEKN